LKLQADAYRYQTEARRDDPKRKEMAVEDATNAYTAALAEAKAHLLDTHPLKLGLLLNYAIFQHEVLNERESAILTARQALYGAKKDLISIPDEAQMDTEELCNSLADNLKTWESAEEEERLAKKRLEEAAAEEPVDES
jgi:14-3-3 protein epsilon